ncbi:hypothetical protein BLOT_007159 [Blomia tropicalis]|nr:hypothetical protein BLOT_007159 [Blomia tropicalis]
MKETNEKKEKLVQDFNWPLENIAMFREATKVSSTMRTFAESYIAPLMEMKIPLDNLTNQDFEKIKELNESINKKLENSLLRKTLDTSTVELNNFIGGNILNVTNSATFDENKDRKNLATKQIS